MPMLRLSLCFHFVLMMLSFLPPFAFLMLFFFSLLSRCFDAAYDFRHAAPRRYDSAPSLRGDMPSPVTPLLLMSRFDVSSDFRRH